MQERLADWLVLHRELARRHQVYLVAASYPVREGSGYVNRAHLFSPQGGLGWQDKLKAGELSLPSGWEWGEEIPRVDG